MDEPTLAALLEAVRQGATPIEDAVAALRRLPYTDLGVAKVDHHRSLRQGMPEVVFGEGKTPDEIVAIVGALVGARQNVLVTRIGEDAAAIVRAAFPELAYNARARTARLTSRAEPRRDVGFVAIITAGTSDLGVAEEAAETLDALAIGVAKHYDVGVAGIHRLLHRVDDITKAAAVIVVAGMEGALPSVVGGIVSCPVIGVPTSVGYGTAFGGVTPLFAMLTSCASGLAVVNIDNGFGAAMVAHRMLTGIPRSPTNG